MFSIFKVFYFKRNFIMIISGEWKWGIVSVCMCVCVRERKRKRASSSEGKVLFLYTILSCWKLLQ